MHFVFRREVLFLFQHQVGKPFNEKHIRHQIYAALPTVTIRDDVTLDAMETRSPWAFSKQDSPFVSTKEYDEKVDQENAANVQKEDIPFGKKNFSLMFVPN